MRCMRVRSSRSARLPSVGKGPRLVRTSPAIGFSSPSASSSSVLFPAPLRPASPTISLARRAGPPDVPELQHRTRCSGPFGALRWRRARPRHRRRPPLPDGGHPLDAVTQVGQRALSWEIMTSASHSSLRSRASRSSSRRRMTTSRPVVGSSANSNGGSLAIAACYRSSVPTPLRSGALLAQHACGSRSYLLAPAGRAARRGTTPPPARHHVRRSQRVARDPAARSPLDVTIATRLSSSGRCELRSAPTDGEHAETVIGTDGGGSTQAYVESHDAYSNCPAHPPPADSASDRVVPATAGLDGAHAHPPGHRLTADRASP